VYCTANAAETDSALPALPEFPALTATSSVTSPEAALLSNFG
jgi:hypothetical protein